ncbi:MAG: hypothetical protein U9O94_10715 [Nanoarchaeota archaeon]|nr:hypothetical protein [Nanoarchaeota archaeon]
MKDLEIPKERTSKFTDEEKMWCNHLFRFLYGNKDVRRKNTVLMIDVWLLTDKLELAKKPIIRKVIHFLRNDIIVNNAEKVVNCEDLKHLPESYKKGCFWVDATNHGYKATSKIEDIDKHIKTLTSRVKQIGEDINSARLVKKALKRMEGESDKQ